MTKRKYLISALICTIFFLSLGFLLQEKLWQAEASLYLAKTYSGKFQMQGMSGGLRRRTFQFCTDDNSRIQFQVNARIGGVPTVFGEIRAFPWFYFEDDLPEKTEKYLCPTPKIYDMEDFSADFFLYDVHSQFARMSRVFAGYGIERPPILPVIVKKLDRGVLLNYYGQDDQELMGRIRTALEGV